MSSKQEMNSNTNQSNNQWIEIIEPKSKVQMFANLITGECRWDEPKGTDISISRASNPLLTQWWELYDTNSQRFYYYCAKDSKTVWKKPQSHNSIVVPLAKLQILKQNTTQSSASSQSKCDAMTQTTPQVITRATQTPNYSQINTYHLNNQSFRNPSLKHYLISEARFAKGITYSMRDRDVDVDFGDKCDSNDDFDDEDMIDYDSDLSCDADDEYDCEEYDCDDSHYESDSNSSNEDERQHFTTRRQEQLMSATQRERQLIATTVTTSTTSQSMSQSLIPTKSHSLTQISINSNNNTNSNRDNSINKRMTATPTTTTTQTLTLIRPQTPPNRQMSHTLSLMPNATQSSSQSLATTATEIAFRSNNENLLSIESFAKENNISRHRKRGLFIGRKVSLKSMLEWSKKSIRKPMISSISDQKLRQESKAMFKLVQKFMKDLASNESHENQMDDNDIALYLLTTATQQPILRDELLVQIARQTTNNPSTDSELRGLQLMCSCFWYFPPSNKLAPHLNAFLASHSNPYAREVVRRKFEQQLRRSQQSHVVYVRKPHDKEEVQRVLRCVRVGFVGVFGELLSDAVIGGKRLIPWPIVYLTEALLRCRCNGDGDREGVFRCVGDLDEVNQLKMRIDTTIINQLDEELNDDLSSLVIKDDIHVIASSLKLYFRELKEPVIPFALYSEALDCAHDPKRATNLIMEKMPKINKLSLSYLIRFLQVFSAPEHVCDTKMDDANLSMVWAPNILRSANNTNNNLLTNTTIFEQTRSEMSFVRTLIQNFDTSFMSGIQ